MWDILSPAHVAAILTATKELKLGQSHTVKQFERPQGSSVHCDTLWLAICETFAVVAQDQRVLPEGKLISYDQDHTAVSPRLDYMEETLVPNPGFGAGRSLQSSCYVDRYFPHWLGSGNERPLSSWSVEESSSFLAHELPGDDCSLQCVETFPPRPKGPSCACPYRQHISGLLHKSSGVSAFVSTFFFYCKLTKHYNLYKK